MNNDLRYWIAAMLFIVICAFLLSGCASPSKTELNAVNAPTTRENAIYVNDVLPKGAYTERYVSADTTELERIDVDLPCKHFGAGYYFPQEDYVALMLIDKEALAVYYPDITTGVVLNPRIFINELSAKNAIEIGEHCGIAIYQPKKELA